MNARYIAFAVIIIAVVALVYFFITNSSSWNPYATAPQPGLAPIGMPNVPTLDMDTFQTG